MKTVKLQTERLYMRPIKVTDIQDIFECWMQDEEVSRYMFWKSSNHIKDTEEFVEYELGMLESDKWYRWLIFLKETDELVGTCLIYFNEEENNWDISYNLAKKYWGNGYITEAMQKVMDYAVEKLHIKECIAIHAVENSASGNVIQKLGFHYEKEVPYECNGGEIHTTGKFYRFKNENDL